MNHNEQTTISLPKETKRKVRILAAELGIPMGKTALKLIEAGLEDYCQRMEIGEISQNTVSTKPIPPAA